MATKRKRAASKVPAKRPSPGATEPVNPRQDRDSNVSAAPAPFEPTPKQLAYLFRLREAVATGGDGRTSDVAIAPLVKVSRQTVYEWRQAAAFRAWLSAQLTMERDIDWDLVLDKHHQLAIRGSVRSAEFLAKVRSVGLRGGGFEPSVDVDQSVTNYQVVLLAPRPPALPESGK